MSVNKKYISIEILFLLIPLIISYVNAQQSSLTNFSWGYDHINAISNTALFLGILGNIYIHWQNKKSASHSHAWSIVSISLLIILAAFLYIGNSLSNFGF